MKWELKFSYRCSANGVDLSNGSKQESKGSAENVEKNNYNNLQAHKHTSDLTWIETKPKKPGCTYTEGR